jgi:hypothetical protein
MGLLVELALGQGCYMAIFLHWKYSSERPPKEMSRTKMSRDTSARVLRLRLGRNRRLTVSMLRLARSISILPLPDPDAGESCHPGGTSIMADCGLFVCVG